MVLAISGVEKDIPRLLDLVRNKLSKERDVVDQLLQKYRWIEMNKDVECKCAAVDSSFLIIESRIGFIYLVQGVAVLYSIENNVGRRVALNTFSDAGFINVRVARDHYIVKKLTYKKVLTEYAYTLELSNLVKIIDGKECDMVLIDGSLISFAMSRRVRDAEIYIESVKESHNFEEIQEQKIKYLEHLAKRRYTVFLAKSSNAGFYTQGVYPDMYVLELARLYKVKPYSEAGFLEPLTLDVKNTLSKFVNEFAIPINQFTITYARLNRGLPVYQLSFPYRLDVEELKYVYACLRKWSPSGYPIPLEYVHRFSQLPKRKIMNVMTMMGIPIVSGREIIEIGS